MNFGEGLVEELNQLLLVWHWCPHSEGLVPKQLSYWLKYHTEGIRKVRELSKFNIPFYGIGEASSV